MGIGGSLLEMYPRCVLATAPHKLACLCQNNQCNNIVTEVKQRMWNWVGLCFEEGKVKT
jgi:hypothetical protein